MGTRHLHDGCLGYTCRSAPEPSTSVPNWHDVLSSARHLRAQRWVTLRLKTIRRAVRACVFREHAQSHSVGGRKRHQ